MRIKILQDMTAPWGEAKEGQIVDVLPSVAKRLVGLKLAAYTHELAKGQAEAVEHAEQTKGDGAVIIVASPQELQAVADAEAAAEANKQSESSGRKSRRKSRNHNQKNSEQ
jgi:hypothetical protein